MIHTHTHTHTRTHTHTHTHATNRPQISPSWVDGVWLDASRYILDDGKTAVTWALDDAKGWLADRGVMQPAGPAVAGWRWKHGFVGNTDGYSPATFPELITTDGGAGGGGGGGINATYQLVYELDGGTHVVYSYPSDRRLVVSHPRSTAPLAGGCVAGRRRRERRTGEGDGVDGQVGVGVRVAVVWGAMAYRRWEGKARDATRKMPVSDRTPRRTVAQCRVLCHRALPL